MLSAAANFTKVSDKVKAADGAPQSNASLPLDADLQFPGQAGNAYMLQSSVLLALDSTGSVSVQVTAPSGASGRWFAWFRFSSATFADAAVNTTLSRTA